MSELDEEVAKVFKAAGERVIQRVSENEPGWLGVALDQAVDLVRDNFPDTAEQTKLVDSLTMLEQTQLLLEPLGKVGVRAVLRAVWDDSPGKQRSAFLFYLGERATFEERRAAMTQGTRAAHEEQVRREVLWETISTILEQIGEAALRALIPCLVAAV